MLLHGVCGALQRGLSAQQIVDFLSFASHPRARLPDNVRIQIMLWERERDRLEGLVRDRTATDERAFDDGAASERASSGDAARMTSTDDDVEVDKSPLHSGGLRASENILVTTEDRL